MNSVTLENCMRCTNESFVEANAHLHLIVTVAAAAGGGGRGGAASGPRLSRKT